MAFNPLCYCTVCPCDVLLSLVGFMCMDVLYFLFLYFFTFTSTAFYLFFSLSKLWFFIMRIWIFAKKEPFLPPDRQLFSWEMAKMTLCLCSQLNLHCSRREHRQMLTLHFSLDSICTGSTSARLFCLPNMRITSHLFIYEGANQLHRDSRAAGSAADPHGRNLSSIQPYCTHRCISRVQK